MAWRQDNAGPHSLSEVHLLPLLALQLAAGPIHDFVLAAELDAAR